MRPKPCSRCVLCCTLYAWLTEMNAKCRESYWHIVRSVTSRCQLQWHTIDYLFIIRTCHVTSTYTHSHATHRLVSEHILCIIRFIIFNLSKRIIFFFHSGEISASFTAVSVWLCIGIRMQHNRFSLDVKYTWIVCVEMKRFGVRFSFLFLLILNTTHSHSEVDTCWFFWSAGAQRRAGLP